ncbi:MAG: zinc ribbon domain-containing protein [Treponema sp.]|nr:zinc ribbon domain-containing protein [Treponema sp.]
MMKCKKCGEELEKGTKVCPKCGKKQKTLGKTIISILIIIFAVNIGFTIFMNIAESIAYSKMTPEEKIEYDNKKKIAEEEKAKKQAEKNLDYIYDIDNSYYAYELIKSHVKGKLKSPSTAKFPSKTEVKITKNKDTYIIQGYVDSQNSFGATVRTKYIAEIQQIGKDMEEKNFLIKLCDFYE